MSESYKKYKIETNRFRELYYFALQYYDFKSKLKELTSLSAVNIDGLPHGTGTSDPTANKAATVAAIKNKIAIIEECANETEFPKAVLKGVTTQNVTYNWLRTHGYAYCGKNEYYRERRKFYFLLDKKL